jgi:protein-tyrosine phosphatase
VRQGVETGVIDFHNHLLPAVDDGAEDVEQALAAARQMWAQGVREVVVTPHLRGSVVERAEALEQVLGPVDAAYRELRALLAAELPELKLHRGVELMLDAPSIDLADPRLRLAGTNFVLVEFPGMMVPPHSVQALYQLRLQGWWPIVAHPERYHNLDDVDIVDEWRAVGAHLQLNAGSVLGRYGQRVEENAWALLAHGWIDYLSSDYHARGRLPLEECRAAFGESGGQDCFEQLTRVNPGRMLEGQEPLPPMPLERRRSLWQRLRRGRT